MNHYREKEGEKDGRNKERKRVAEKETKIKMERKWKKRDYSTKKFHATVLHVWL
jgi:hypothetical protein